MRTLKQIKENHDPIIQRLDGVYYPSYHTRKELKHNKKIATVYHDYADCVIFQSNYSRLQCVEILGERKSEVDQIIHNGVDPAVFFPSEQPLKIDEPIQFILTGSIRVPEMLKPILDALDSLQHKFSFHLHICGPIKNELTPLCADKSYIVTHDEQTLEGVANLLRKSHIFLFSSVNPPCPNVVLEAATCGLPVVSFDSGSLSELLPFSRNLLAPVSADVIQKVGDFHHELLAERILLAVENLEELQTNSRNHATDFVFSKCGDAYLKTFSTVKSGNLAGTVHDRYARPVEKYIQMLKKIGIGRGKGTHWIPAFAGRVIDISQPIIQALWIGESLSPIERLCASSFIHNGHEFHLYAYNELTNVPEGVIMKDANEIIPKQEVFLCRRGSYAIFSDWFRWTLLHERGGWWVDMDVICLKPFIFDDGIVFAGSTTTTSNNDLRCEQNIMRFPADHPFCKWMENCCAHPNKILPYDSLRIRVRKIKRTLQKKGKEFAGWGESGGPAGFTRAVKYYNLAPYAKSRDTFLPQLIFPVNQWHQMLLQETDESVESLFPDSYAFHIGNEFLRRAKINKNAPFPESSLLGKLSSQHVNKHSDNKPSFPQKFVPTTNFDEFRFTPAVLSEPRKPGISAYMRIKNEEQFVGLSILSHIDYYDEIIACYNDCTDNTEAILLDLAKHYPHKLKVYHYLPKVHPPHSQEHKQTPDDSVHGLANYYNYALSKTTYQVAVKLDADHLAIPCKLAPLLDTIRRDMAAGKQKIYMFSGINLGRDLYSVIGITEDNLFSGTNDINYHPVNEQTVYHQSRKVESFNKTYRRSLETEYMGIMYFHLKALKKDYAGSKQADGNKIISFDEFCSPECHRRFRRKLNLYERSLSALYASERIRKLKYQLTGRPPRLPQVRMARLADDLKDIDFKRDALMYLT